jgi:hypothetical protein
MKKRDGYSNNPNSFSLESFPIHSTPPKSSPFSHFLSPHLHKELSPNNFSLSPSPLNISFPSTLSTSSPVFKSSPFQSPLCDSSSSNRSRNSDNYNESIKRENSNCIGSESEKNKTDDFEIEEERMKKIYEVEREREEELRIEKERRNRKKRNEYSYFEDGKGRVTIDDRSLYERERDWNKSRQSIPVFFFFFILF